MNLQPSIRYPATWEANLLAATLLIALIVSAAILSVFFNLSVVLVGGQLLFIVPALLWIAIRRFPLQATFRLYPISARTALWSVLIGIACWPVTAGIATLLEKPLLLIGPTPAIPLPTNWIEGLAYAFTFIVLAPLTEEPIFRGFVLQAWLRRGSVVGIVLAGFLFGLLHSQIAPVLPITLFGIVLGLLAYRSQSILSSILAHAAFNSVASLFVCLPSLQGTEDVVFIIAGAVALPVAALLVWSYVRRNPPPSNGTPPRENSPWVWPILSLLVVLGLFGLMALLEIVMRLNPNLSQLK
jgi:membrane protease YdiL (CAAX protease family)